MCVCRPVYTYWLCINEYQFNQYPAIIKCYLIRLKMIHYTFSLIWIQEFSQRFSKLHVYNTDCVYYYYQHFYYIMKLSFLSLIKYFFTVSHVYDCHLLNWFLFHIITKDFILILKPQLIIKIIAFIKTITLFYSHYCILFTFSLQFL